MLDIYITCTSCVIASNRFTVSKLLLSSIWPVQRLTFKEAQSYFQLFSRTLWDIGINRCSIFFSLPTRYFIAKRYPLGKVTVEMWLVMVTIIKLTQNCNGACNLQNCFVYNPSSCSELTTILWLPPSEVARENQEKPRAQRSASRTPEHPLAVTGNWASSNITQMVWLIWLKF